MHLIETQPPARFAHFADAQVYLAARAGGEPFDYARDRPATLLTADELGIGAQVRAAIEASRALDQDVDASVQRANAQILRFDRREPGLPPPSQSGPNVKQRTTGPLPRFWIDDANLSRPGASYLIKGLLGARLLSMVYGPPGSGKTFFTTDIAGHIGAGLAWRGRRTAAGLVVYVAAEAGASIEPRFVAWRDRHIGDAHEGRVMVAVVTRGVNLLVQVEVARLLEELRAIAAEAQQPLALVVLDTLSRSIAGGDENAASDITRVVDAADWIRDELGAGVLIVHHGGKDPTRGARGHSALTAACDTVIRVEERVAYVEKVRDGIAGETLPFELEVVHLGIDQDGDPRTTCVVAPSDQAPTPAAPRSTALGKNQEIALATLRTLLTRARKNLQERGDDPATACILISDWRAALEKHGIDRFRYREVSRGLQERGLIRLEPEDPHVYLAEPAA